MADPLSIAASVAGLLATAGKIYTIISEFTTSVVDAPNSARSALRAIEEMTGALTSIQRLISTLNNLPPQRKALIQLDYLAITSSHCILTLAELESVVCRESGFRHRLQWAWEEKKVLQLLARLDSQKYSLTLIITILQCQSDVDARQSRDQLNATVNKISQQNEDLAKRLQYLEGRLFAETQSVKLWDNNSTIVSRRMSTMSSVTVAGPSGYVGGGSNLKNTEMPSVAQREFELTLERSRVYTRVQSHESDVSFTTSTAPSNTMSMLSGVSLNDISIIAVFRLPLTLDDINRFGPGLTFGALLGEQALGSAPTEREAQSKQSGQGRSEMPSLDTIHPSKKQGETEQHDTDDNLENSKIGTSLGQLQDDGAKKRSKKSLKSALSLTIRKSNHYQQLAQGQSETSTPEEIKLVVVGDGNSLKQKIVRSYTTQRNLSDEDYVPVVFDNCSVDISVGGKLYTLVLCDTPVDYHRLRALSYPNADIFLVLCHQVNGGRDKVEDLWIPEISHHCPGVPYIIVGTISHSEDPTWAKKKKLFKVGDTKTYGDALAQRMGAVAYLECDVGYLASVNAVFELAIKASLQHRKKSGRFRQSWAPPFLNRILETNDE